jgi:hypothetical protein
MKVWVEDHLHFVYLGATIAFILLGSASVVLTLAGVQP